MKYKSLVKSKNRNYTQETLEQIILKKWQKTAHHLLILQGRYTCKSQKIFLINMAQQKKFVFRK
tara:strand:- start:41 stop:232 length:192 start_codon:yes stop_codon:yes gene_type:complete